MNDRLTIYLNDDRVYTALIQCKNPFSALLYIYGRANGGIIDTNLAKQELSLDDFSVKKGVDGLLAYGICKVRKEEPDMLIGDFEEITNLREVDYGFSGVCQMYESAKGKIMRPGEIQSLYNIYVNLNMSADMITLLIGFLNDKGRFSLRNIEKTAAEWHDANVSSYDAAEEYLNRKFTEKNIYRDILNLVGISGRDPVSAEKKYIDKWISQKIPYSLISLAYEKTLFNIKELRWPYINKILTNWCEKGYLTPNDVEKGETKNESAAPAKDVRQEKIALLSDQFDKERREREDKAAQLVLKLTASSKDFADVQRDISITSRKIAMSFISGENVDGFREKLDELNKKREIILAKHDLTTDMIDPKPKCNICGDRGFIGSEMCKCFKDRLEKL